MNWENPQNTDLPILPPDTEGARHTEREGPRGHGETRNIMSALFIYGSGQPVRGLDRDSLWDPGKDGGGGGGVRALEMVESLDMKTLRPRVTPPVRHLASAPVQCSVHCLTEPDI